MVDSQADRIRVARENKGWSQRDLAIRSGLSQAAISNIEAGSECRGTTRLKIANALGVNLEWLRSGDGPMAMGPDMLERVEQIRRVEGPSGLLGPIFDNVEGTVEPPRVPIRHSFIGSGGLVPGGSAEVSATITDPADAMRSLISNMVRDHMRDMSMSDLLAFAQKLQTVMA
jgi:DNA-binding XRE family transcriptional regulator